MDLLWSLWPRLLACILSHAYVAIDRVNHHSMVLTRRACQTGCSDRACAGIVALLWILPSSRFDRFFDVGPRHR
jgi:hypothetical protein